MPKYLTNGHISQILSYIDISNSFKFNLFIDMFIQVYNVFCHIPPYLLPFPSPLVTPFSLCKFSSHFRIFSFVFY